MQLVAIVLATFAGLLVGLAFGLIQQNASLRYQKKQLEGTYKSNWGVVPGSFSRIGYLLIALILVQVVCPILFESISQWFVSGGLALGYGYVQFRQLMRRRRELAL